MKNILNDQILLSAALMLSIGGVSAASKTQSNLQDDVDSNVKVEWQKPEKFTDVRPANESRLRYRERVLSELEEHFQSLAEELPQQQSLEITVTNVDLAGRVFPASFVGLGQVGTDIRVVKQIEVPQMSLSYKLLDETGVILKEEEVKLRDVAFLQNATLRYHRDFLRYEKKMLDDWFKKTFRAENS